MKEHRFISLERVIKNGFINFGRNIYLSVAAIAMMAITLTILLFAVVSNAAFHHTIEDYTSRIDVTIALKDSVSEVQRNRLITQLQSVQNVESVDYISKVEALKIYEEQTTETPKLLGAIQETGNVLPVLLVINPRDPNQTQSIKDYLDQPAIASLYSFSSYSGERKQAIDNITKATRFFQQAGVVGIIIFTLISMMIIFNTIRMAIFNRRDELVIMRLLGASPWFIRGPYVVESMLYGVVAAILSVLVCAAIFAIASSTLQASTFGLLDIGYSSTFFKNNLIWIILIQLAAGIIIGAASSAIAARRYLKISKQ
ncbi:FtsX-like permease family protein [Candidatus Saccharibacteria bacterium]|nr:FtsX-like permease family protein [Candidatus Saccharibacteria bacterium]